jgi:hypothetical protein
MNTLFTDHLAAVEEGDFIQNDLKKTALLVVDKDNNMHVITEDQYSSKKWKETRVLEIFHRGGSNAYKRVLLPIKRAPKRKHTPRISHLCDDLGTVASTPHI